MKRNNFLSIVLLLGIFTLTNLSCNKDSDAAPTPTSVSINSGSTFSPGTLTVKAGTTVVWTNNDATAHTVTSDSGTELASSDIGSGGTYVHTFSTTGTFPYYCIYHGSPGGVGMSGTIVVIP